VHCSAHSHDWAAPPRDCGPQTYQDSIIAMNSGGVAKGMCAGTVVVPAKATVLPYGSSIVSLGYTCSTAESGVTCTQASPRHHFVLSKQTVTSS